MTPENTMTYRGRSRCRKCNDEGRGTPLPVPTPPGTPVVYFISDGMGHVKIGITTTDQLTLRVGALQTGNAFALVVEHVTLGGADLEAALHAQFADLRVRGEWFRFSAAIKEHMNTLPEVDLPD